MGFVCTATAAEIELIGDTVVVPIGHDDAEPKSYSLLISFDVLPVGHEEFFICLVETNTEDGTEVRYWSGLEVSRFTSKEDRILIRHALLDGTQRLLEHRSPKRVFCCTHDLDVPVKALTKHVLIAHIFGMFGYNVRHEPKCLGKEILVDGAARPFRDRVTGRMSRSELLARTKRRSGCSRARKPDAIAGSMPC
jgi:hypothetical protein